MFRATSQHSLPLLKQASLQVQKGQHSGVYMSRAASYRLLLQEGLIYVV
jgi:hypothetical protein